MGVTTQNSNVPSGCCNVTDVSSLDKKLEGDGDFPLQMVVDNTSAPSSPKPLWLHETDLANQLQAEELSLLTAAAIAALEKEKAALLAKSICSDIEASEKRKREATLAAKLAKIEQEEARLKSAEQKAKDIQAQIRTQEELAQSGEAQLIEAAWKKTQEQKNGQEYRTISFRPGNLGLDLEVESGQVHTVRDGRAKGAGVKVGWRIVKIDGADYSLQLYKEKRSGSTPYDITFLTSQDKIAAEKKKEAEEKRLLAEKAEEEARKAKEEAQARVRQAAEDEAKAQKEKAKGRKVAKQVVIWSSVVLVIMLAGVIVGIFAAFSDDL